LNAEDGEGTHTAGRFRVETGEHDGDEVPYCYLSKYIDLVRTCQLF